ncbi:MAG: large subunit ribosomal protein L18, partial [Planctomycetota bacterium]
MKMTKKESRLRRAKRARSQIELLAVHRLCIFRTPRHIYAQIIAPGSTAVLASASTVDKEIKGQVKNGGNIDAAVHVGKAIAERAKKA